MFVGGGSEGQKMVAGLPLPTFFRKKGDAVIRCLCAYSDEYGTYVNY